MNHTSLWVHKSGKLLVMLAALALVMPAVLVMTPTVARAAAIYYVATNGSDSNPGTITAPFATIQRGVNIAGPGDIVYVRAGMYRQSVVFNTSGSAASGVITLGKYPSDAGEVIIEGRDSSGTRVYPASQYATDGLITIWSNYVTIQDLTLQYSTQSGISANGTYGGGNHVTIRRVKAQYNMASGIRVGGSYGVIEDSEAHYNCMNNEFAPSGTIWGAGLTMIGSANYGVMRRNKVWENWGEGLSTSNNHDTLIEDNLLWDNFSTNFYIQNTYNSTMRRNLSQQSANSITHKNSVTGSIYGGSAPTAVSFGDEPANATTANHDNTFVDNLLIGGYYVFEGFGGANNIVSNNTIVNAWTKAGGGLATVKIWPQISSTTGTNEYTGAFFENNIIEEDGDVPIAIFIGWVTGTGLAPTVRNNNWSKTPPTGLSGAGDKVGNPYLAKTGTVSSGQLTAAYFALTSSSPARGSGVLVSAAATDYHGNAMNNPPDMGAIKYVGSVTDTQAPSTPANFTASANPPSSVSLSWTASTDNVGVAGYNVYRNGSKIGTTSNTSYVDSGLVSGSYSYAVSAYDAANNQSVQTSVVSVELQTILAAPSNLSASAVSSSQINVSWSPSPTNIGVAGYNINRNGNKVGTTANVSYSDAGLNPSTSYTYTVSAFDNAGNTSASSVPATAITQAGAPVVVLNGPFTGKYYASSAKRTYNKLVMTRTDQAINFDWNSQSPTPQLSLENYAVHWTGTINFPQTGTYSFTAQTDDGMKIWIDNVSVLNQWSDQVSTFTFTRNITAGNHSVKVDYYQHTGGALAKVSWTLSSQIAGVFTSAAQEQITRTLAKGYGTNSQEVFNLQQFLYDNGYLSVLPTGVFGDTTERAVMKLQADYGITPTGIVGPLTRKLINNLLRP